MIFATGTDAVECDMALGCTLKNVASARRKKTARIFFIELAPFDQDL